MLDQPLSVVQVDVGPAADLPPGFFDAVRNGTSPRAASSSDSGGGARCSAGGSVLGDENYLSSSRMRVWSVVFAGAPELALVSTSNASYYY